MSAIREAFDAVRALALASQSHYDKIYVGALPEADSLVMELTAGGTSAETLDLHGDLSLDVVINCKHSSHPAAIDALAQIHYALTTTTDLPVSDDWQVLSISTSSAPRYLDYDGDQWLYGSGIDIHLWIK